MCYLQADHGQGDTGFENNFGGVRINPNIELGSGSPISEFYRATHDDDFSDQVVHLRQLPDNIGNIRQRPGGNQSYRFTGLPQHFFDQLQRG